MTKRWIISVNVLLLLFLLLAACAPATTPVEEVTELTSTAVTATPLVPTVTPPPSPTDLPPAEATRCQWPTNGWESATPEEHGMDSATLAEMFDYMPRSVAQGHSMMSVLVVRDGCLVLEAYFHPYGPDDRNDLWSCTKSVTSMLIGIALAEGYLDSLDQHVLDFFPDRTFRQVDERKQAMTIRDLLTMQTGLDWPEDLYSYQDPNNIVIRMINSSDWVQFVLDHRMIHEPGTAFEYNTGASHLLSVILERATQMRAQEFAQEYLFGPLGITNLDWLNDPQGSSSGGHGLILTPRDMAKLGYLYLRQGEWNGVQIVPAEWVEVSTQQHVAMPFLYGSLFRYGYGYQWWVFPEMNEYEHGVYSAIGYQGQYIFVVPDQDVVVVLTQWDMRIRSQDSIHDALWYLRRFILHSIQSDGPLPPNPEALARLQAEIEEIAQPPR